jgi:hypothetical protein
MADFVISSAPQIGETLSGVKCLGIVAAGPNYTTGGNVVTSMVSYFNDEWRTCSVDVQGTALYHGTFIPGTSNDVATGSIKLFDKDGTEVANATDLTGVTFMLTCTGTDG